jgi:hypothetical protein
MSNRCPGGINIRPRDWKEAHEMSRLAVREKTSRELGTELRRELSQACEVLSGVNGGPVRERMGISIRRLKRRDM